MLFRSNWEIFKEELTASMNTIFLTGRVPSEWMKSHIILLPKIDEPKEPKDFRPLTIGNTVYRLLMKVVATRLQPFMEKIISPNQTAFLKGRNIADNTILVREIMHSFGSSDYKDQSFLLKADVNKAFDTVQWSFVGAAMREVNVPHKLIDLIQGCLCSSQVTILVNGMGDGFLRPCRGLRQGCPLSPYLFILAMEFLTKSIDQALQTHAVKGIKLAATAPILTHVMYGDDLLMGKASVGEVNQFLEIMKVFEKY